jgi:hypothetical protein
MAGWRAKVLAVVITLTVCSLPQFVGAAPVDELTCEKLGEEQASLKAAGVEADIAKGYHWARDNLSQGDLNVIRRFIEVSEQIKFRCHGVTKPPQAQAGAKGGLNPAPPLPMKRSAAVNAAKPAATAGATPKPATQPQKPPPPVQRAGQS